MDRYHRQQLLPQVGSVGQTRLASARVVVIGCGALGTVSADLLVRAGVGFIRLIDRDLVELTNLQRQTLYDETDAAAATPKAVAAAGRLAKVNSAVNIQSVTADVHSGNVLSLVHDADIILDGTDNADVRYLINDVAVHLSKPWVYGAAVGTEGRAMLIVPGRSPCLRCVFPDPPLAGELPTCDTVGVLGPTTAAVGALQANLAMQQLFGVEVPASLISIAMWPIRFHSTDLSHARRDDCPACAKRRFEFMDRAPVDLQTTLCGQDAVQIRSAQTNKLDMVGVASRLASAGRVQQTPFMVRCDLSEPEGIRLTVFSDGRAIINGTTDLVRARSLYARFIGT